MGRKKELEKQLRKAEAKAERWKAEARENAGELKRLRKRLEELETPEAPDKPATPQAAPDEPSGTTGPDASWSLTRLRAEARERGVTGYSRQPKDELLRLLAE